MLLLILVLRTLVLSFVECNIHINFFEGKWLQSMYFSYI